MPQQTKPSEASINTAARMQSNKWVSQGLLGQTPDGDQVYIGKMQVRDAIADFIQADKQDLVEALQRLTSDRHNFIPPAHGYGDVCARCAHDLRHWLHYRSGESERSDYEFATQALARHTPREEQA